MTTPISNGVNTQNDKTTCMACSCPCDIHKEHNHKVSAEGGEEKHEEAKTCSTCGQKNSQDGKPTCSCKH